MVAGCKLKSQAAESKLKSQAGESKETMV